MSEVHWFDPESVKKWAKAMPRAFSSTIATRAAIRTIHLHQLKEAEDFEAATILFRALLVGALGGRFRPWNEFSFEGSRTAFKAARRVAKKLSAKVSRHEEQNNTVTLEGLVLNAATDVIITNYVRKAKFEAAQSAASCSELKPNSNGRACAFSLQALVSSGPNSATAAGLASRAEQELSSDAANEDIGFASPVWNGDMPKTVAQGHLDFIRTLGDDHSMQFWLRFYNGIFYGTFIEWDLALEVIQIDEADWKKGYQHIGKVIAGIEARLALQDRIAEVEIAVQDEHAQRRGIGDNHPPQPIDDIHQVPPELVVLWEPLLEIKEETRAAKPNVSKVKKAVNVLIGIASACGAWSWDKANVFLDAGLKAAGTAAGVSFLSIVMGHGDKVAVVIEAALKWIGLLN